MSIYPVVLCGGSGSRLWPMSRGGYPKQYLKLTGETSLLQQTALRLKNLNQAAAPILISHEEQRFLVAEQVRKIGIVPDTIVLEPAGRNTAPAVAIAALIVTAKDPDGLMLVMPSDHVIRKDDIFARLVDEAAEVASLGKLVTFGIKPTSPQTGYGYILRGDALGPANAYKVQSFVEKPDLATAERFLGDGRYYWNSGMFMLKASVYLSELRRLNPDMLLKAELSLERSMRDGDFTRLNKDAFLACPADSIDYAVMEKTTEAAVIEAADLGWSDIGSWDALADIGSKDAAGNTLVGDVLTDRVSSSYIRAEHRMVAAIGVDNIVIVETADAILVAHKDKVQDVKKMVERLNASGRSESVTHRKVYRPWGSYEGIDHGDRFQVKRIIVSPGSQLSLQMHHHRAEHWIVVKGTALVDNGDQHILLTENQSTYIPLGTTHRLKNPGKIPLELIEVQSGAYLGEDDIVRFEDTYGRVDKPEVVK
ncbi:mannose-1-phosphate guanylyltransferase/mannose-6-phosphate isomerase [Silvimonas amylolytica]|uniref:mannose-1-phosphate guanylyltransferase n=1 Tax=Silvimonas amylolytica TaxID=449663 RepID=A0ABQ2PIM6_9NEIS|nr:mannose-1-phosphate guanylyltransferase/mannose-6-phosphate isomerase [Silvimonas amylolytica]GGP25453.1 GDP-mannose pyrophosphorylase [Silvimonas amylolytica]